jgi:hypothetical protein
MAAQAGQARVELRPGLCIEMVTITGRGRRLRARQGEVRGETDDYRPMSRHVNKTAADAAPRTC